MVASAIGALVLGPAAAGGIIFEGVLNPGAEPTVFAVLGDFGAVHSSPGPAQVASMVKSWKPDFIVAAGDLNYGQTTLGHPDWDSRIGLRYGDFILGRADRKYALQGSPVQRFYPVIGNHDTTLTGLTYGGLGGGNVVGYVDYFVRNAPGSSERLPTGSGVHGKEVTYYDFHRGDMHFIMADSDRGRVDAAFAEAQNAWIRHTLQSSSAPMKFVVSHHPAWSSDAVHTSQAWMQGAHLSMADAVFAGHAHVYERLEVDGTAHFTTGLGGRSFYPFKSPPLPQSQFRHNTTYGALRVTRNTTGALCEFLSIEDGAGGAHGGTVIDSHALGSYEAVANVGTHLLEAVAGQSIRIETSLPVPPGGSVNALDPRIEILASDGMRVAADDNGAADGVNAALTFMPTVSGRYRLAILPENATSGEYRVSVDATPGFPADPYTMWAAQNFGFDADDSLTAPDADPDDDGRRNLLEYSTGTDPLRASRQADDTIAPPRVLGNVVYLDITLPAGIRADLSYEIQASGAPGEAAWTGIATYAAAAGWTGTAPVVTSPGEGPSTMLRVTETGFPFPGGRRFYRLKVQGPP